MKRKIKTVLLSAVLIGGYFVKNEGTINKMLGKINANKNEVGLKTGSVNFKNNYQFELLDNDEPFYPVIFDYKYGIR